MSDHGHSPHGNSPHGSTRAATKEEAHEVPKPARTVDYSRPFLAEQEVGWVLKKIVNDGGHMLYQRYLERKAFPFAVDAAVKALISNTQMCFVPCETADEDMEDWAIEAEPQTCSKDSWVRMMLPKRDDVPRMRSTFASSKNSGFGDDKSPRRRRGAARKTSEEVSAEAAKAKREKAAEGPRTWALEDKVKPDIEEERQREEKFQNDATKREKERKAKEKAKTAEQERIRVEALHEEMDKRPHTFDLNGEVMWVEPPNLAKLPKMVESLIHHVPRDKTSTAKEQGLTGSKTRFDGPGVSPPKPKPKRRKIQKKNDGSSEFPDGCIPLSYGQPPIMETIKMKTGVSLEQKGKSITGPPKEFLDGRMTRNDYITLTHREISGDTQLQFTSSGGVRPVGGNSGNSPVDSSSSRKGGFDKNGDTLPPIEKGRPPAAEGGSSSSQPASGQVAGGSGTGISPGNVAAVTGDKEDKKKSPLAPPMHTRVRKFDSVGHLGRPPRIHPPLLGKLNVFAGPSTTQPPLGATMGHGLLRTETSVEEFFFPSFVPESPTPGTLMMPRSKSDSALPKDRRIQLKLPSKEIQNSSPKNLSLEAGADDSPKSPIHGSLIPEKSPAYRNVRKQLFPGASDKSR